MKSLIHLAAAYSFAALAAAAWGATEAPEAIVRSTVEEVLAVIQKTNDSTQLRKLAEQKVLPHFDTREMTRLAVGASWRKATPEQQRRLEEKNRALGRS